jgi:tyrosyl-tRNA synthetase
MDKPSTEQVREFTKRGIAEIIPRRQFMTRLRQGKPLRLKMGFDPSHPDLHLGHVVGLRKLRQLQDMGHELILIVGDWTAQIGDPSGQSDTRNMLSAGQVRRNAKTYMRQFFEVVDRDRTQVRHQSEWFSGFGLEDVFELTSHFTVNQFLHRSDFAKRFKRRRPIAITELLYPLMQAYDSVMIQADVEFGGTDQKFNLMVGRELQRRMGQRPQMVFLMPILPGTDGVRRMGKSLGNFIAIKDTARDMFGKIMSLPDDVVPLYFELLTDVSDEELAYIRRDFELRAGSHGESVNPIVHKKHLGLDIVSQFHSPLAARRAQSEFERVFQRRELPSVMPEFVPEASTGGVKDMGPGWITAALPRFLREAGLASSSSEASRLLLSGAVRIDEIQIDWSIPRDIQITNGSQIRVGPRRVVRIVWG